MQIFIVILIIVAVIVLAVRRVILLSKRGGQGCGCCPSKCSGCRGDCPRPGR